MGRNLGPLNIKDTYEGLVQITSGSILTDGSGSDITYVDVSASYANTAGFTTQAGTAGYATSAGTADTSGYASTAGEGLANYELGSYTAATGTLTFTRSNATTQNIVLSSVPFAEQAGTAGFAAQAGTAGFAVTASYATFASGAVDVNAVYTASAVDATVTFEKGDLTTFPITVNNVANAVSASHALIANVASFAATSGQSGTAGYALTASYAADYVLTASYSNPNLTFTKGDGSTFDLVIATDVPSLQNVTDVGNITTNNITAPIFIGDLQGNADTATSASFSAQAGTAGYATTAGFATDVNALYTASVADATISFLKGGGGTFPITINNVANATSASWADQAGTSGFASQAGTSGYAVTASYALTASSLENPVNLQSVLDAGNSATKDMSLTGSLFAGADNYTFTSTDSVVLASATGSMTAGKYKATIGAKQSNNTSTGENNVQIGTREANMSATGNGNGQYSAEYSTIGGASGACVILGGYGNSMNNAGYSSIMGGESNTVNVGYSHIIGSISSQIPAGSKNTIVGGQETNLNGGQYTVIVGGYQNTSTNASRTVVLGGYQLNATLDDRVYVPALISSGSITARTDASITGNTALDVEGESYFVGKTDFKGFTTGTGSFTYGADNNTFNENTTYSVQLASTTSSLSAGAYKAQIAAKQSTNSATNENNVQIGTREANLTATGVGNGQYSAEYSTLGGSSSACVIVGGYGNGINNGGYSTVIGGESNTVWTGYSHIIGSVGSNIYSGTQNIILGGSGNTLQGCSRSAIIGGQNKLLFQDDTVLVPNLIVSGSVSSEVLNIPIVSTTASMDCSLSSFFDLTLANGVDTRLEATNLQSGQTINLRVRNNAVAAGTLSFGTNIEFPNGTPFTVTSATNAVDIVTFVGFGGTELQATGLKNFS